MNIQLEKIASPPSTPSLLCIMEILDKLQSRAVVSSEYKMGRKQRRQVAHSEMHLAWQLLGNMKCAGSSRSLKRDNRLGDEEESGGHQKLATS